MAPDVVMPSVDQLGGVVPREVLNIYDRGLQFLADTQLEDGSWGGGNPEPDMTRGLERSAMAESTWAQGGKQGPGVTGLALLALLASGEDPNFGIYSGTIRKAMRNLVSSQDPRTGYFGPSMYHHGFAMLALAEAYGAVDERNLWPEGKGPRSVGEALELAVQASVTAQKSNPSHAWRYAPNSTDADSSISGSVIMGLLAARNAGIEVPEQTIEWSITYLKSLTTRTGDVVYMNAGDGVVSSPARVSIATLVFAIARRKTMAEYRFSLDYLKGQIGQPAGQFGEYTLYYEAQALFQGDPASWDRWNKILIRRVGQAQQADGSIQGRFNPAISTSLHLLSLALNYRFLPIYER